MLKKSLPLLGLFLLLFIGTFMLLGGDLDLPWANQKRPEAGEFQKALENGATNDRAARNDRTTENGRPRGANDAAPGDTAVAPDAPGKLEGRAIDDDGKPVPRIAVRLTPGAGVLVKDGGANWLIEDIPPGFYQLEVWASGHVPVRLTDVEIRPGRRAWREVRLLRGVQPAGKIIDETDLSGVAGAMIEFGGRARARSGSDGRFKAPYVIPSSALTEITVSHDDYDRLTYVRQAIHDPSDMTLAMTRGNETITGTLVPDAESLQEATARLRLFFTTGGRHDLRRELRVKASGPFEFSRVHVGVYDLVLDFPGTRLPEIHREVLVKRGKPQHIDIRIGQGSLVTGRLHVSGPKPNGVKVELINERGLAIAACRTDPDGSFSLKSVPAGKYSAKVWYANPWFNTERFSVDGRTKRHIEIDCVLKRLK